MASKLSSFQQASKEIKDTLEKLAKTIDDYSEQPVNTEGCVSIIPETLKDDLETITGLLTDIDDLEEIHEELVDQKEDLEKDKESIEEEIEEKDDRILELEAKENLIPKHDNLQDELKAQISKRLCDNCSIDQLEHFEIMAAKKKGYDYKTGNDPISPALQKAILSKH